MFYVVSYDIPDTKRRTKLSKCLEDFGDRVQYSVFECILDNDLLKMMLVRINRIINVEEDKVRIYPLCANCESIIRVIGKGEISRIENLYVI